MARKFDIVAFTITNELNNTDGIPKFSVRRLSDKFNNDYLEIYSNSEESFKANILVGFNGQHRIILQLNSITAKLKEPISFSYNIDDFKLAIGDILCYYYNNGEMPFRL